MGRFLELEEGAEPEAGPVEPADESLCTCGGHPGPIMGTHAEHHQVFLYLDPDASTSNGKPRHTHLEEGTRMSLETARRLNCDTSVVPVWEDAGGWVLNIGRRSRTIPPAIRRALWLRERWRGRRPGSRKGGSCPFRRGATRGRASERGSRMVSGGDVNPE